MLQKATLLVETGETLSLPETTLCADFLFQFI